MTLLEEVRRLAALASEMQAQTTQAVGLIKDFSSVAKLLAAVNERVMAENRKLLEENRLLLAEMANLRGALVAGVRA